MTAHAGSNPVLFSNLRQRLVDELATALTMATNGDEHAAASLARREVPGYVAALLEVVREHRPDANGYCAACCSGFGWRRRRATCRLLLTISLARTNVDEKLAGLGAGPM